MARGNPYGRVRIPAGDIVAMREAYKTKTLKQVQAMFPHVSGNYVYRVVTGMVRPFEQA